MYLEQFKTIIDSSDYFSSSYLLPCTKEEIFLLQEKVGKPFPQAYKEFLYFMGHGAGNFLAGEDMFCKNIPLIQQGAKDLLLENKFPKTLPEDVLVFTMHQGYLFFFVELSGEDNPPLFYYHEAIHQTSFELKYATIQDFLLEHFEGFEKREKKRREDG